MVKSLVLSRISPVYVNTAGQRSGALSATLLEASGQKYNLITPIVNAIRNPNGDGAVAGQLYASGSSGLPTFWYDDGLTDTNHGITWVNNGQITVDGVQGISVTISGVYTGGGNNNLWMAFDKFPEVAGHVRTWSVFAKLLGGSINNCSLNIYAYGLNAQGLFVNGSWQGAGTFLTITTNGQNFSNSYTIGNGTGVTKSVVLELDVSYTLGQSFNVTFFIGNVTDYANTSQRGLASGFPVLGLAGYSGTQSNLQASSLLNNYPVLSASTVSTQRMSILATIDSQLFIALNAQQRGVVEGAFFERTSTAPPLNAYQAAGVTNAVPVLGAPSLGQIHVMQPASLANIAALPKPSTTPPIALPAPVSITNAVPVINNTSIRQINQLGTAAISTGPPILSAGLLNSHAKSLVAADFGGLYSWKSAAVFYAVIGAPALGPGGQLIAPALGTPALAQQVGGLTASSLTNSIALPPASIGSAAAAGDVFLGDQVIDAGFSLFSNCNRLYICSAKPASFAEATSFALGHKDFATSTAFTAPLDTSAGRKVISTNVVDGAVTAGGTAHHWAAVDTVNSRLLAAGALFNPLVMISGQHFNLAPFTIYLPSPGVSTDANFSAVNLLTTPVVPVGSLVQRHVLAAAVLANIAPTLGAPSTTYQYSFPIAPLADALPVLSAATLGQTHVLTSSNFDGTAPQLASGGFGSGLLDADWPDVNNRPMLSGSVLVWTGPANGGPNDGSPVRQSMILTTTGYTQSVADGQIIEGLDISNGGGILIQHANVVLRRCRLTASGVNVLAIETWGSTSAVIEDCLIEGIVGSQNYAISLGYSQTLTSPHNIMRRCNVKNYQYPLLESNNWDLTDSWIHQGLGACEFVGLYGWSGFGLNGNINGVHNIVLRHNTFDNRDLNTGSSFIAAIKPSNDQGGYPVLNITIDGNRFINMIYAIYEDTTHSASQVSLSTTNNAFYGVTNYTRDDPAVVALADSGNYVIANVGDYSGTLTFGSGKVHHVKRLGATATLFVDYPVLSAGFFGGISHPTAAVIAVTTPVMGAPALVAIGGGPTNPLPPILSYMRNVSAVNPIYNVSNGGTSTSNNTVLVGTSSYTGATVNVYLGGVLQGTATTDSSGNWTYSFGILADAAYSATATLNVSGSLSSVSSAFTFTVAPGLTSVGVAIGQNLGNARLFNADGVQFQTQNDPTNANACVYTDTHTLTFTSLSADLWPVDSTCRTEVACQTALNDSQTIHLTYEVMLSASSPISNSSEMDIGECRAIDTSPTWYPYVNQTVGNDIVTILRSNTSGAAQYTTLYNQGSNQARGVWVQMDIEFMIDRTLSTTGFVHVWRNGVQIVNANSLNFGTSIVGPYHWKHGIFRPLTNQGQTQIVSYRNFQMRIVIPNVVLPTASPITTLANTTSRPVIGAPLLALGSSVAPGLITSFTTTPKGQFYIDGIGYEVETAGKSYSLTSPDNHTLRYEIRPGDYAWYDSGNVDRSEIERYPRMSPGTPVNIGYLFMVEPGGPNTAQFFVHSEMHNDDQVSGPNVHSSPPFAIELAGEYQRVFARYCPTGADPSNSAGNVTTLTLWTSPNPIQRGQYQDIKIQAKCENNSNGYLQIWINGVEVVNYHGPLGYGTPTYWSEGLYRNAGPSETFAANFRNFTLTN